MGILRAIVAVFAKLSQKNKAEWILLKPITATYYCEVIFGDFWVEKHWHDQI